MKAISFYQENIPDQVVSAQKAVFDHFNLPLHQIKTDITHGEAIDKWLNENQWEEVAIFDIDCIVLQGDILTDASEILKDGNTAFGAAQRANHLNPRRDYLSPAFVCFTRKIWESSGKPTWVDIPGYDVGMYFSEIIQSHGVYMHMLYPSQVETPLWDLDHGRKFGLGTTYGNKVYHAFQARMNPGSRHRFIEKCKEVIGG